MKTTDVEIRLAPVLAMLKEMGSLGSCFSSPPGFPEEGDASWGTDIQLKIRGSAEA